MNQDDELNEMFREGLTEPGHHAEYREADWDVLEKMLDERKKKRGIIVLLPYIGSMAAVLLVVFAWLFFKPATTDDTKQPVAVNKTSTVNGANNTDTKQPGADKPQVALGHEQVSGQQSVQATQPVTPGRTNDTAIAQAKPERKNEATAAVSRAFAASGQHRRKVNSNNNSNYTQPEKPAPETAIAAARPEKNAAESEVAANNAEKTNAATAFSPQTFVVNKPETVKGNADADSAANTKAAPQIAKQTPKTTVKTVTASSGTHFALTILAAPNVNGVGSFTETQAGANVGLLFSVGRGRFTLSTGAMYAKTPYSTDFSNYHTKYYFTTPPEYVNADCRILDIPVDLHYQLLGNLKNKFSLGAGVSSYLMLKENYFYTYANPATVGPAGYEAVNRNKHYFGVLDLDVLYQRRLNSKFSLDLQPYLQLPMTDIGYGKVKLQSAGIAVGFSWNIK